MKIAGKKQREQLYKEHSQKKFAKQRSILIKPNIICFAIELILFLVLMIMDGPSVIFDDSSILFSILLIVMTIIPLISLIIVLFAKKTTHLLITLSLNQLCIIPLIIVYFLKYDAMKDCSSYHMLIFYFFYVLCYLGMTSFVFKAKSSLSTSEEK